MSEERSRRKWLPWRGLPWRGLPWRGLPWRGLPRAIALLTILPAPAGTAGLDGAAGWFVLIGAGLGALTGGVRVGGEQLIGRTPATVLAMIVLVVVSGALHQDGLADTADGLGARGDRDRRLEAMRDSATGVYGALALIGWALLLLTTLASLSAAHVLAALITACALARWAALPHTLATPPARSDGLGAALHVSRGALLAATIFSVPLALATCGLVPGAGALGAAALSATVCVLFVRRTLGGRTGDTLGATIAVTEVVVCMTLLALWHG